MDGGETVHLKEAIPRSRNYGAKALVVTTARCNTLGWHSSWDQADALLEGRPGLGGSSSEGLLLAQGSSDLPGRGVECPGHQVGGGELLRTKPRACHGDRAILRLAVQMLNWPHH